MTATLGLAVSVARRDVTVSAELEIAPGERLALFGRSGAGKTTLIETVAGLVEPTTGAVRLGAQILSRPPARRGRWHATRRRLAGDASPPPEAIRAVSIVRQPTALFPHLDVESNVSYGNADPMRVGEMLHRFELEGLRHALPGALSGGQAQRVALARALARDFSVLLLDEPMSAVDVASRPRLWSVIEERCRALVASALLVTHDLHEAQAFGDRIAVMDAGAVVRLGTPHEVVAEPLTRAVASLVGYRSFLELLPVDRPGGHGPTRLQYALDPARVRLGSAPDGVVFAGRVTTCRPSGSRFEAVVALTAGTRVLLPGRETARLAVPTAVTILVDRSIEVGTETTATAVGPPVVVGNSSGGATTEVEMTGRLTSDRGETAIRGPA